MTLNYLKNKIYRWIVNQASFILKIYWKIFKPITVGVRAIVLNPQHHILLVQHRHDHQWYLPGGQVRKNENLFEAIKRELQEETLVQYQSNTDVAVFGIYTSLNEGKCDHIVVFIMTNMTAPLSQNCLEIETQKFFSFDRLPEKISPGTYRRLQEHKQGIIQQKFIW